MKLIKKINVILIITVFIFLFMSGCKNSITKNNNNLLKSINNINSDLIYLNELTLFEWDTLYTFQPYTSDKTISKITGIDFDFKETYDENTNQIIFVKDNNVVCYLSGYPSNNEVYFKFDYTDSEYLKFSNSCELKFNVEKNSKKEYVILEHIPN